METQRNHINANAQLNSANERLHMSSFFPSLCNLRLIIKFATVFFLSMLVVPAAFAQAHSPGACTAAQVGHRSFARVCNFVTHEREIEIYECLFNANQRWFYVYKETIVDTSQGGRPQSC
jgi:hypothetical protein